MLTRPDVEIQDRGSMHPARKARIHKSRNGVCWMCGFAVPLEGPAVVYDHKLPLELGGPDEDWNIWPLHKEPCDRIKTAADRRRIAKAKRIERKRKAPQPTGSIPSRPFGASRPFPKDNRSALRGRCFTPKKDQK